MYQVNRVTYGTTGAKTLVLGGSPKKLRITLGSRFGTSESYEHLSVLTFDGTNLNCVTTVQDGASGKTENFTNKLSHWERSGGVNVEVINANSFAFSGNTITFTVNTASLNYQWLIETDY